MQPENLIRRDREGNEFIVVNGKAYPIAFRVPFIVQFPVISNITVGATSSAVTVQIDTSSNFIWQSGIYEFDIAAAQYTYQTRPIPNMTVVIQDSVASRLLSSAPVPVGAWFGAIENPIYRDVPYMFSGGATITVTATNFDAATATGNLRLSMIGQQVYFR